MTLKLYGGGFGLRSLGLVGLACFAIGSGAGGWAAWQLQDGKVARAEVARDNAKRIAKWNYDQALGWQAAKTACERNRGTEQARAVQRVDSLKVQADARVAEIRRSRAALERLMARPVKMKDGCPVEEVLWAKDYQWEPSR